MQLIAIFHANRINADEAIRPAEQAFLMRDLNRVWQRYCTPQEMTLLFYILDRSIGWGKLTFRASQANILEGDDNYAGICLKRTALQNSLTSLEKKKMIVRKRSRDFVTLGLNIDWNEDDMKLPIPKRKLGKITESGDQKPEIRAQNSRNRNSRSNIPSPSASGSDFDDDWSGQKSAESQVGEWGRENLPELNFEPEIPSGENCSGLQSAQAAIDAAKTKRAAASSAKIKAATKKPKSRRNTTDLEAVLFFR